MPIRLTVISVVLAMAAAIFLLAVPEYTGFDGNHVTHATLLEINGTWALVPVMFPLVIALVPLMFPARAIRIAAAILIFGFAIISSFSIGLFYLPAAIVTLMAASAGRDKRVSGPG